MGRLLGVRFVAVVIVALGSGASGCSGSATIHIGQATIPQTPVDQLPSGRQGCSPSSPFGVSPGGKLLETKGTAVDGAELYGLVMPEGGLPLRVGEQIKIVWRMTGLGPLRATAASPSGTPTPLTFGPDSHGSSDYQRPGDEWGTGYLFTQPGCWHLHFARDDTQADVWFQIIST